MTPEQIAKANTEHAHQAAFFCWLATQQVDERLKKAFAVPNGGERNKIVAARMKAEGVREGVPDVFIPIPSPCGQWHGLFIEFKKPGRENRKNGGMSDVQVEYRDYLISQNFGHFVAYSYRQAVDVSLSYLCRN